MGCSSSEKWASRTWGQEGGSGGGGAGTPSPLIFGGFPALGEYLRPNGVNNQGCFSSLTGSEHQIPVAGNIIGCEIIRSNTTSEVTFLLVVDGVIQETMVIPAATAKASFTFSPPVPAAAMDGVAIEYDATGGSSPDFCTGTPYWEVSS
jgi:hypothetical protein